MNPTEFCQDDSRRDAVRAKHDLNGLDYLDVSKDQRTLTVYFLGKAPAQLLRRKDESQAVYTKRLRQSVRIEGGRRIRNIDIVEVTIRQATDPRTGKLVSDLDDSMIVRVDKYGDFSTYTLRLVGVDWIDRFYDHLDFTFKVGCASDLDCLAADICPPVPLNEPEINYLAKDYASFRQLILDRLALIMPDWQERHVPDLGIALIEVLAYAGDHLSYYQDAVATEAYLDTAHQRISVRRHVRLVDYQMHEGCNARAWVCVGTESDLVKSNALDPKKVFFITGCNQSLPGSNNVLSTDDLRNLPAHQYEVFEPITSQPIELYAAHNEICFYTWGNRECCLPKGATCATLKDGFDLAPPKLMGAATPPAPMAERKLHLHVGDVLIFEEIIGPKTGHSADADLAHRHAVRLTNVTPGEDTLYNPPVPILEIEWTFEDALPFPVCLSASGPAPDCKYIDKISVARGNVILVDHGRTELPEDLGQVPCKVSQAECDCENHPGDITFVPGLYRPKLLKTGLTYREPFPLPSTVAQQQARIIAAIVPRVRERVAALLRKVQGGQTLSAQEIDELRLIVGSQAMNEAGALVPSGKAWDTQDSTEQLTAIEHLLAYEERWLKSKAQRVMAMQARAQSTQVLNDAASEIDELFGKRYAEELAPDSRATLGPASLAMQQDMRAALPQIVKLKSIPTAPATNCEALRPFFTLKDVIDPTNLISTLYDAANPLGWSVWARLSRETEQQLNQLSKPVAISETLKESLIDELTQAWFGRPDLLSSQPDDSHYVAEIDNDGRAQLRFGNGELGRMPEAGSAFFATYRVGNGIAGNVGPEAISHLVLRDKADRSLHVQVRNPLPAAGGTDAEPIADVKLFAPAAFRKQLQRAITAADYARLAEREFNSQIQHAASTLRWTGSWYEAQVAIDPLGSETASPALLDNIGRGLELYRRIGHDLTVLSARYIALDIEMFVCVLPHYLRGHVEAALLDAFSNRILRNGNHGLFHRDKLTFGQDIYLSMLVATAQSVTGVESIGITKLQRLYEEDHGELLQGVLKLGALEVARLDNDPSFPEHGRLVLELRGGR